MIAFNEYLTFVAKADRGEQRLGQLYMNSLHYCDRKDLYNDVHQDGYGPLNPFYHDHRVPAFLAYIADHWVVPITEKEIQEVADHYFPSLDKGRVRD